MLLMNEVVTVQSCNQAGSDRLHSDRLDPCRIHSSRLTRVWRQLSTQSVYWLTAAVTIIIMMTTFTFLYRRVIVTSQLLVISLELIKSYRSQARL